MVNTVYAFFRAKAFPWFLAGALVALLNAGIAEASFEVNRILIGDVPDGTPGLGGAIRARRDPYVGDYRDTGFEPLYLFEGKWLYSNGTSGGLHIFDNETFFFDLNFRFRFDKLNPEDSARIPDELQVRQTTIEGGFSTGLRSRLGDLRLEWGRDVLGRNDGQELDLTYRYSFDDRNLTISPFITLSFLDATLANYYFGVTEEESQLAGIPAYEVGDTTNVSIGVNTYWQATDHFFVYANLGFDLLNSDITASPIVTQNFDSTLFVGGGYLFGPVRDSKYVSPDRAGEWSWRVNYGYAGDSNIALEPMTGDLARSDKVNTKIAGFTLGKLLEEVQLFDIYGKLSAYRHIEDPYQDDFWSFAAYVMGIGKAYLPWSDKLAFRWGFGMGASYAQQVPILEQIKQAEKNRNTNRFLTYLEWTVDFPIDSVIKSKLVRNCFLGVTVVHRSGIFSSSALNGEVGGGSDYYTGHIECLR